MFDHLSRLRKTAPLRELFQEVRLSRHNLVYPIFVQEDISEPIPIASLPGQVRWPLGNLGELAHRVHAAGVPAILVFGLPSAKDPSGSAASSPDGVVAEAVRTIKDAEPDLIVITDVCLCAYTDHGHCGIFSDDQLDQAATRVRLGEIAVSHAQAGADIIAPSSMMDGQVFAVRQALDTCGFHDLPIMGYSAKYASALYGPFREAADSTPQFGNRAAYQHPPANGRHSRREVEADLAEGADIVMVKPGSLYLDVLSQVRSATDAPVAVYHVSGEYAMIKAAAERGWIDEKGVVLETMTAFRRAEADLILTYYALDVAEWIS